LALSSHALNRRIELIYRQIGFKVLVFLDKRCSLAFLPNLFPYRYWLITGNFELQSRMESLIALPG
jgi:hypothetical protein